MDKYDETAIKLCEDQDRAHHGGWTCSLCRHIAAALRESAAEAFEEFVANRRPFSDPKDIQFQAWCDALLAKAASLHAHEVKTEERP